MSENPKNCPFCGNTPAIYTSYYRNTCSCRNEQCFLFGVWLNREAWDARTPYLPPEVRELMTAARALLESSEYMTRQRCSNSGEPYMGGTDAEADMRDALAGIETYLEEE